MRKSKQLILFLITILLLGCNIYDSDSDSDADSEKGEIGVTSDGGGYEHVIMVYLDGDNDLEYYALSDLEEMESSSYDRDKIKVVVLIDRVDGYYSGHNDWTGTRLYEIEENDSSSTIDSTRIIGMDLTGSGDTDELNMGDEQTVTDFVSFCKETYTSENFSLIFWNHGGGWRSIDEEEDDEDETIVKAICWDETSNNDALYMAEVGSALNDQDLAVIGFDACLMGMFEVAYQLKDAGHVMVASQENEPGTGWDYTTFLDSFTDSDYSAESLAEDIVVSYSTYYGETLSAVDLIEVNEVNTRINTFAENLVAAYPDDTSDIVTAWNNTVAFNDTYIDLYQFASNLSSVPGSSDLITALDSYILNNYSDGESADANGVSIYLPLPIADSELVYYISWDNYQYEIDFTSAGSSWIDLIQHLFKLNSTEMSIATSYSKNLANNFDGIYKFTAGTDDSYTFTTSQTTDREDTDTILYLYDEDFSFITGNEDINKRNWYSRLTESLTEGSTYYILVTYWAEEDVDDYYYDLTVTANND